MGFLWGSPKAFGGDVAGHSEAGDSNLCRAASRLGHRGSARNWRPGLPGVLLRWISGGVTGTPGRPGACWIVESWRYARAVGPLERMASKLAGMSVPLVEPGDSRGGGLPATLPVVPLIVCEPGREAAIGVFVKVNPEQEPVFRSAADQRDQAAFGGPVQLALKPEIS